MDKSYLVTKSNYFIMNSSYDLSLEEQKLILTLASMIQPTDEEFKPYKFKIADFMKLLGVDTKTKYTEIPKITKELMKKILEIDEGDKLIQAAWLSSAVYEKGTGYVELEFSPKLKPYMLQLKERFTQYQLANVLNMKSKYSPRIYELLKCNEFKKQGYIEIEITELRKFLKVENMYPRHYDFKKKIIMQAQKELKNVSDISFDFEEIKTGRKVTSVKFYIKSNKAKSINYPIVNDEIAITLDDELKTDKSSTRHDLELLEQLLEYGISFKQAKKILQDYSAEQIQSNINYAMADHAREKKNNFVGFLVKAIEENYAGNKLQQVKIKSKNRLDLDHNYDIDSLEKKLLQKSRIN